MGRDGGEPAGVLTSSARFHPRANANRRVPEGSGMVARQFHWRCAALVGDGPRIILSQTIPTSVVFPFAARATQSGSDFRRKSVFRAVTPDHCRAAHLFPQPSPTLYRTLSEPLLPGAAPTGYGPTRQPATAQSRSPQVQSGSTPRRTQSALTVRTATQRVRSSRTGTSKTRKTTSAAPEPTHQHSACEL